MKIQPAYCGHNGPNPPI